MKTRLFASEIEFAENIYLRGRSEALVEWLGRFLLIWVFFALPGFLYLSLSMSLCPGEDETAKSQAMNIVESCKVFFVQQDRWPESLDELAAPSAGKPVMERVPQDPWGNDYRYRLRGGEHQDIRVVSMGPDGIFLTDDDIVYNAPRRDEELKVEHMWPSSGGGCDR